jgi:hypothetical protein
LQNTATEEWHKDQSCFFKREDYRNKCHYPKKLPCIQFLVKIVSAAYSTRTLAAVINMPHHTGLSFADGFQ